ncbi:MAG: hypothetical protein IPP29_13385 [Bacteroidetes bacterium]|nr:hypothetical protein [Bacteroidota bacterium]
MALRCTMIFVLLFIISVPFEYYYFPNLGLLTSAFFEWITQWIGDNYFEESKKFTHEIISDSTGMYIHASVLAAISFFAGITSLLINIQTATKENKLLVGVAASYFYRYNYSSMGSIRFSNINFIYEPNLFILH